MWRGPYSPRHDANQPVPIGKPLKISIADTPRGDAGPTLPPRFGKPDFDPRFGQEIAVPIAAGPETCRTVDRFPCRRVVDRRLVLPPGFAAGVSDHHDSAAHGRPRIDPRAEAESPQQQHQSIEAPEETAKSSVAGRLSWKQILRRVRVRHQDMQGRSTLARPATPHRPALYTPSHSTVRQGAGVPRGQGATPFALYAPSGAPRGQCAKGGAHPGCTRRGEGGVLERRAGVLSSLRPHGARPGFLSWPP